jgi:outer membrane receptor protein involved in Fe transport
VSTPINQEEGNIYGFELQGQYFLGDSGFGVSGSFTKVYGDVNVDVGADPTVNVYALVGLADSFNITGLYDKNGISARVSYNWRDKFLAAVNQNGNNRNPLFFEPFGTVDASVSVDVTENISVSLEGVNLLSEPVRSYARDERQLVFAGEQKPRVFLGARFRF